MKKVLIIIPTYNEIMNIKKLIEDILSIESRVAILVVDDNSPDGTGNAVELIQNENPRVKLLKRPKKMGLGSAYMAGFHIALKNNFNYAITMDADFSHNPKYLPALIDSMDSCDICIGSRYAKGGHIKNWSILRKMISRSANLLAKTLLNSSVKDNTTGFRCYQTPIVQEIINANIQSQGYSFLVELIHFLQKKKYKINEIPIEFEDRRYGNSKISKKEIFQSAKLLFKLGILNRITFKK